MRLILGSASPRRRELLTQIGIEPDELRPADINEDPYEGEPPHAYCVRIATEKSQALNVLPGEVLLTADTTVALGRRILGKPADEAEARAFLDALSGRRHRVITAVAVRTKAKMRVKSVTSFVKMKRLSEREALSYLSTGDWKGKAGGYAIQGPAGRFIPWIRGSYPAIMGLPLAECATLLEDAGYPVTHTS